MNRIFNLLNRFSVIAIHRSEIIVSVFSLVIVFMLIIPLPLWVIDIMIALNIELALILVMLAMYLKRPLAFSSFPGILLLTTVFRLALSIATTRQILLQQDAGEIVETFGDFVVGGNLAVGMVIFLILTVVNFLVITKGAERVAEVAARFNLDAMPGKQMSIDSDLRAGLVDVTQAKVLRSQLVQESQLFGAMDGAMKFVKGDAIAGIIILFVNLIGGFSIGVFQLNMTASESARIYSILTIGDGLIAQIPALLISLSAGLIITRVAPDQEQVEKNIGHEIVQQMVSQPKAWILAGFGMLCFALLPGMPGGVFITLAAIVMLSSGYKIWCQLRESQLAKLPIINEVISPELNGKEDLREFNTTQPYILQFPESSRETTYMLSLLEEIRQLRNSLVTQAGLTLPVFHIDFSEDLAEDEFCFYVYEIPAVRATFSDTVRAVEKRLLDDMHHIDSVKYGLEQRREEGIAWLPANHPLTGKEEIKFWDAKTLLLKRMKNALYLSCNHFISIQETSVIMQWLGNEQPELAQELQRIMPLTTISTILQNLATERISLRTIRAISEALIEHGQYERDITLLTDLVRISLKSHICYQYQNEEGLNAWLLTPLCEEYLRGALRQTPVDVFFSFTHEQMLSIRKILYPLFFIEDEKKYVIVVAQDLRRPLRRLIQDEFNHVAVLSFSELFSDCIVNVVGRLDFTIESDIKE